VRDRALVRHCNQLQSLALWSSLPFWLRSAPVPSARWVDLGGSIGPVLVQPRHGVGAAYNALESAPGGILKRLFLKSLCRVLDQFAQVLIARTMLKSISNPGTGPAVLRELNDTLAIASLNQGVASNVMLILSSAVRHWVRITAPPQPWPLPHLIQDLIAS
jgi:hypothetical protein